MSFSRKQQGKYRPMAEWAWQRHCKANALALNDPSKRAWYETELEEATGFTTTVKCDPKRDFESAMAHFEGIAGGGPGRNPFYWNERKYGADARRIIHTIREKCGEFDVEEEYMCAIAKRTLKLDMLPPLESLSYPQLLLVLRAVIRDCRSAQRQGTHTVPVKRQYTLTRAARPRPVEQSNIPF